MESINHPAVTELKWVEKASTLLDSKFTIPGTKLKFGLDPILGLIPGVGSATSLIISGILVMIMGRHGASGKVIILMLLNLFLDAIIGSIPILGTAFDIFFQANKKNLKLLQKHYSQGKHQGSGIWIIVTLLVILFGILIAIAFGLYELIKFIWTIIESFPSLF